MEEAPPPLAQRSNGLARQSRREIMTIYTTNDSGGSSSVVAPASKAARPRGAEKRVRLALPSGAGYAPERDRRRKRDYRFYCVVCCCGFFHPNREGFELLRGKKEKILKNRLAERNDLKLLPTSQPPVALRFTA